MRSDSCQIMKGQFGDLGFPRSRIARNHDALITVDVAELTPRAIRHSISGIKSADKSQMSFKILSLVGHLHMRWKLKEAMTSIDINDIWRVQMDLLEGVDGNESWTNVGLQGNKTRMEHTPLSKSWRHVFKIMALVQELGSNRHLALFVFDGKSWGGNWIFSSFQSNIKSNVLQDYLQTSCIIFLSLFFSFLFSLSLSFLSSSGWPIYSSLTRRSCSRCFTNLKLCLLFHGELLKWSTMSGIESPSTLSRMWERGCDRMKSRPKVFGFSSSL